MSTSQFFRPECQIIDVCGECGVEMRRTWAQHPRRTCEACQRARSDAEKARRTANPISKELRAAVIARDGMTCRYCGGAVRLRTHGRYHERDCLELDHVTPLVAGGRSTFQNLVVSCMGCNKKKRGKVFNG